MKKITVLLLIFVLFSLTGCQPEEEKTFETQIFAMDTVMTITATGGDTQAALTAAREEIERLEALLSVTDENSEISAVNRGAGTPVTVSEETADIVRQALSDAELTGGRFNIAIYPISKAWGFTTVEYRIPEQKEIRDLLQKTDVDAITVEGNEITIGAGMEIDLGGIAKGYAGDAVRGILSDYGVTSAIINLGGDVQLLGTNVDGVPWRVAVQEPDGEDYICIVRASNLAVATSGSYERFFIGEDGVRYHHIIDPVTGAPAQSGLSSVTVVTESGSNGDALATALFIMGAEDAADFWRENGGFEALMVSDSGEIFVTEGFVDMYELTEENADRAVTVLEK